MRFVIYGAGAVGGAIGARLHAAGYPVALIARGDQLLALQRNGLLLRTPAGDQQVHPPAYATPAEAAIQPDDIVFLTMKSQDTTAALAALDAVADEVPIVCAQNGVANERMAARRFRTVYGLHVLLPSLFLEPGVVVAFGTPVTGVLDVGRFPAGVDERSTQIAAALSASGFVSRPVADILRLKYAKLLVNLTNALDAILGGSEPGGGILGQQLREEALAVYRAAGIDWAGEQEYQERELRHYRYGEVPGAVYRGSSTWQSLAKGRSQLEVDYLNGEICLLGALHGVPTPLNAAVRRLAQQMAARGERPGSRTLADLTALLGP
ncbi:MAG: 2-dehydropantoate 2-reductase [Chloroflexi bacterium]|nr:2-dehydropantoate 2-reductase [Chloroflexota bacterium]